MKTLRLLSLGLCVLALHLGSPSLAATQSDVLCVKFRKLMEQPGLRIEVSAQAETLLPREVVEPIVSVTNQSSRLVEIPNLEKTSGVLVSTADRAVGSPGEEKRQQEAEFCSFPTLMLQPGEQIRFHIAADKSPSFESVLAEPRASLPVARSEPGTYSFALLLGRTNLYGKYIVEEPTIDGAVCLLKTVGNDFQARLSRRETLIAPSKQGQYCRVFVLATVNGIQYLYASAEDSRIELFHELRMQESSRPKAAGGSWWTYCTNLKLLPMSGRSSFAKGANGEIVKPAEFGVYAAEGKILRLSELRGLMAEPPARH